MKNTLIEIFKPTPIELTQKRNRKKDLWKDHCGKITRKYFK